MQRKISQRQLWLANVVKAVFFTTILRFFSDFRGNCTVLFISIIKTGSSVIVKLSKPTGRSTLFMSYLFIYCYKQVMREWIQCRGTCSTPTEHNVDAPDIVQLLAVGLRNHRTSRIPWESTVSRWAVVVMWKPKLISHLVPLRPLRLNRCWRRRRWLNWSHRTNLCSLFHGRSITQRAQGFELFL